MNITEEQNSAQERKMLKLDLGLYYVQSLTSSMLSKSFVVQRELQIAKSWRPSYPNDQCSKIEMGLKEVVYEDISEDDEALME